MELCAPRFLSNLPHNGSFNPSPPSLHSRPSLTPKRIPISLSKSGLIYIAASMPRATTSDETSTSTSKQFEQVPDEATTAQEVQFEAADASKTTEETPMDVRTQVIEFLNQLNTKVTPMDVQIQVIEFLNQLNMKLSSGDAYTLLGYGSGASVALWISSALVGAIDSIPLLPKVLEIIGLGFTIWFSYRYVIFKKDRDELSAKIEEFKQQIIGSTDD
ncbi:protein CURVATURE THYLAKOID 1D, chloroplastic-like isoform X1 [Magnolia sinica]|uniref:protein CURVATURE THYLAKOID 1D, chloroplastic-like isoform X1 n=1 Tax=Magnolia sinica TaxID=86752 RepID=UPI00265A1780|nr:protein CURVATURE THYLAKOID 1D, chloroplastic-like isoform X1 [Magnolia sinica]XP_058088070.1 protein CURVATURE THYLAKOID 1D, chloroplastic-like isoform X1 [Magnolia sinica]XP_058088077.1 protein CURVATURE THYLAKOID 1D, chloroplastic-like isoform X1 [Magnolia sinica]XP_058088085.1 protein CURVATURE THYLAKOID 1D, chloroplastic-like isoform X1 [Magnolia sinica]XP_058088096.1 protein CURVATURE THYLAKOID 1D, chloroplastic-like isoform X1 [Magnolia sinica]